MTDKPLYALSNDLAAVREAIEAEGDFTDRDTGEVTDTDRLGILLASLKMDMAGKVAGCLGLAAETRGTAAMLKAEEERLAKRRRILEAADARLRRYVAENMEASGVKTLEAGSFRVTVCAGRESVVVEDATKVPEALHRVKIEPDISAAKEQLAHTGTLPPGFGVRQGAPYLRIT